MKARLSVYLLCLASLLLAAMIRPLIPQAVQGKNPEGEPSLPHRMGDAMFYEVVMCMNPACEGFRGLFIDSEQRAASGCKSCGQDMNRNALTLPSEGGLSGTMMNSGVYVLEDAAYTTRYYVALFERHDMNYASIQPLLFLYDVGYTGRIREYPTAWEETKVPRLNPPITLKKDARFLIAWAEWEEITAMVWYGDIGEPHPSLVRYTSAHLRARLLRGHTKPLRYGIVWTPAGEGDTLHADLLAQQVSALLAAPKNQLDSKMR